MPQTLTLKITLSDIKPPIWRRIVVPASYTFQQLHHVIQVAMGWDNYHLWQFWDRRRTLDSVMLGPLPPGETAESWLEEMNQQNAAEVRLSELLTAVGQK